METSESTLPISVEPPQALRDRCPDAVLCLHGLTGSPFEWRPMAEALAARGWQVTAPRLVGHGQRAEILQHTRWEDWLGNARRAFDELAAGHRRVFVVGLSMGALVSLVLAHERGARVGGVVAMATPLSLAGLSQRVVECALRFPLADVVPFLFKSTGPDVSDAAVAATIPGDNRIPLAAAASLVDGQRAAADRAGRLTVPVLVLHGRGDHVAPVRNAHALFGRLRTRHRRLIIYPRSWHLLPVDVDHEAVTRDVLSFVADPVAFTDHWGGAASVGAPVADSGTRA